MAARTGRVAARIAVNFMLLVRSLSRDDGEKTRQKQDRPTIVVSILESWKIHLTPFDSTKAAFVRRLHVAVSYHKIEDLSCKRRHHSRGAKS